MGPGPWTTILQLVNSPFQPTHEGFSIDKLESWTQGLIRLVEENPEVTTSNIGKTEVQPFNNVTTPLKHKLKVIS